MHIALPQRTYDPKQFLSECVSDVLVLLHWALSNLDKLVALNCVLQLKTNNNTFQVPPIESSSIRIRAPDMQ